eukprot:TRINITY_DN6441_c0_g1_i1.p1 TRINITY_DN6441_c0_g1~~TRINITY_DN6441_c0_g1_i1.p1  ORF type:complete len:506 (+),score=132.90 TRINITY_DN6441_c0_g1_i1:12-1529(+)
MGAVWYFSIIKLNGDMEVIVEIWPTGAGSNTHPDGSFQFFLMGFRDIVDIKYHDKYRNSNLYFALEQEISIDQICNERWPQKNGKKFIKSFKMISNGKDDIIKHLKEKNQVKSLKELCLQDFIKRGKVKELKNKKFDWVEIDEEYINHCKVCEKGYINKKNHFNVKDLKFLDDCMRRSTMTAVKNLLKNEYQIEKKQFYLLDIKEWLVEHYPIRNCDLNMDVLVELLEKEGYLQIIKKIPIEESRKTKIVELSYDLEVDTKKKLIKEALKNFALGKYQYAQFLKFTGCLNDTLEFLGKEVPNAGLFMEKGESLSSVLVSLFDSKEKIQKLTVPQIKENLKKRKLSVDGKKDVLVDRLFQSIKEINLPISENQKKPKKEGISNNENNQISDEKGASFEENPNNYVEKFDYVIQFKKVKDSIDWGRACREAETIYGSPAMSISHCIEQRTCSPFCALKYTRSVGEDKLFDGKDVVYALIQATYKVVFTDPKYTKNFEEGMFWGTTAY